MTAELLGAVAVGCAFLSSVVLVVVAAFPAAQPHIGERRYERSATRAPLVGASNCGFTTIELMVTLGILAILTVLAAPSLISMVATQRVKTATFDLYSAMSYARSEAIKRNTTVTISPHAGSFAKGYDLTVGGTVIRSELGSPNVAITAPSGVPLAFDAYGRLTSTALYQMELTSGTPGITPKRCLVISTTGRPSIRVDSNHDGNCING